MNVEKVFHNSSIGSLLQSLLAISVCISYYLSAGLRDEKRSHAGRPIGFTQWSKNSFFAPQGRHVAPINVKFGVAERTACPLHFAKFHVCRGRNVGIQPRKLSKFRILAINLPLRGDSFAVFLRNSQRLYASMGSF